MALSKRNKRWLILLVVLVGLLAATRMARNRIARAALEQVAAQAGKSGYTATFEGVEFSLLGKHIRITGLSIAPSSEVALDDSASTFTIKADAIDLKGVDVKALLAEKRLVVGHVKIHSPEVAHAFATRTGPKAARTDTLPPAEAKKGLAFLQVDTLLISDAKGHTQDRAAAQPAASVGELDLLLTGISIAQDEAGKAQFNLGTAQVAIKEMKAHLEPFYDLAIDSIRVDITRDSATVFGLHFTPEVSPKKYHKEVDTQVELYEAHVDTILLQGFDLAAKLNEGALYARGLVVAGVTVDVYRDKSIPVTVERPRKALLAEKIQAWKMPVALGQVKIRRGQVTYHERLERGQDYGSLSLGGIEATLTGIDNLSADGSVALHLNGEARLWDRARAHMDIRQHKGAGNTQVEAHVTMRHLPATELNRMTDELVHLTATRGNIHFVEMRMKGDDVRASGTVVMHYDSLELRISPSMKWAGLLSFAANSVVRSTNMPGDKHYKEGRFHVERKQETSVFNYLWLGLRTGMMEVMLPEALLNQLKKSQEKKGREKAEQAAPEPDQKKKEPGKPEKKG